MKTPPIWKYIDGSPYIEYYRRLWSVHQNQVDACKIFINIFMPMDLFWSRTSEWSYTLKHCVEFFFNSASSDFLYISNESFLIAAIELWFQIKPYSTHNAKIRFLNTNIYKVFRDLRQWQWSSEIKKIFFNKAYTDTTESKIVRINNERAWLSLKKKL